MSDAGRLCWSGDWKLVWSGSWWLQVVMPMTFFILTTLSQLHPLLLCIKTLAPFSLSTEKQTALN